MKLPKLSQKPERCWVVCLLERFFSVRGADFYLSLCLDCLVVVCVSPVAQQSFSCRFTVFLVINQDHWVLRQTGQNRPNESHNFAFHVNDRFEVCFTLDESCAASMWETDGGACAQYSDAYTDVT